MSVPIDRANLVEQAIHMPLGDVSLRIAPALVAAGTIKMTQPQHTTTSGQSPANAAREMPPEKKSRERARPGLP